jgi:uncharacterized paraquat-inducible protein A
MSCPIHVRCPGCRARIKAPAQLIGQTRDCPRCRKPLVVQMSPPDDSGPVLLSDDYPASDLRRLARAI